MGFDEHRIRLEKQKGGSVSYEFVFIDTHATKETKKRLREGEIGINDLDQLDHCSTKNLRRSMARTAIRIWIVMSLLCGSVCIPKVVARCSG
ncbi:hypothetical protein L1987_52342 [Smallanthus sonchifolius]|uniref:Uncharacterized protein n=1 Tax=Smallanthus sonchifolius TaxID=185202 RepID=A0ACB9ESA7_9ASTR|nr:hypothetical protein L1987_52342 [Smallanthus sonchifolius]